VETPLRLLTFKPVHSLLGIGFDCCSSVKRCGDCLTLTQRPASDGFVLDTGMYRGAFGGQTLDQTLSLLSLFKLNAPIYTFLRCYFFKPNLDGLALRKSTCG
jgi:hypothetical protein